MVSLYYCIYCHIFVHNLSVIRVLPLELEVYRQTAAEERESETGQANQQAQSTKKLLLFLSQTIVAFFMKDSFGNDARYESPLACNNA